MENKEDWEELEKWSKKQEENNIKKFGIDISKVNIHKENKKMSVFSMFANSIYKFTKYAFLIITIFVFCLGLWFAYTQINNFERSLDIGDVKENLEHMYNIKIREVSRDTDEKENGRYTFILKDNEEITFTAFKNGGDLIDDYNDNCHKYYFEKWDNEYKNSFVIEEKLINGILNYSTYIEIQSYDEIESAVKKINRFIEYSKEDFKDTWKIYLKRDELMLYPYSILDASEQEVIDNAKKRYLNYIKNKNIKEDIPNEEFEKYLQGSLLKY